MKRRDFLKSIGSAALAFSLAGCAESMLSSSKPAAKPNIIYILADDMGYGDLGCYGQKIIKTPNIDNMAAQGIRFTQHYAGSTVCAPSRSSLLTGQHTGHTFIRGNKNAGTRHPGNWPLPTGTVTIANMLKNAGYTTACFGKWGLGFPQSTGDPLNQGFDRFFGYNSQHNAHFYYPDYLWDNDKQVSLNDNLDGNKGTYAHDLIADKAAQFIKDNADRPFFVYLSVTPPHAELHVPKDSMQPYLGLQESGPFGDPNKPYHFPGSYNSQALPHAAFAGMVSRLDNTVGNVLKLLKELDLDDNTLVIFTSDNGAHREGGADPDFFNSTGPLRGIKRDLYEGGIRVPMIAQWPGRIKPGTTTDHISAFWDVMPTCADVVGIDTPDGTDGISFAPTLFDDGRQQEHIFLYWEFHEQGGKQAVRIGKYKGVRLNVFDNPTGPIELYDLETDIGETTNIADQHPLIVRKIAAIMKQQHSPSADFPIESLDK